MDLAALMVAVTPDLRDLKVSKGQRVTRVLLGHVPADLQVLWVARETLGLPWDERTSYEAAKAGRLDVLQYLHAGGCPWDANTANAAAARGSLELLSFVHSHGCPWNARCCASAARNGNFESLVFARELGCPWDENVTFFAAARGELEMLVWARSRGCPWSGPNICSSAAQVMDNS